MINTLDKTELKSRVVAHHEEFLSFNSSSLPSNVLGQMKLAIERFNQKGFPTPKIEAWKYTNLKPFLEQEFSPSFSPADEDLNLNDIEHLLLEDTQRIVFVNGWFSEKLSQFQPEIGDEVIIATLDQAFREKPDLVWKYFVTDTLLEKEALVNLNTAYTSQGVFVYIAPGKQMNSPLQVLYINSKSQNGLLGQTRNIFVAEKGSKVSIVESYHSISDNLAYNNNVTDVFVAENGFADITKVQDENLHTFHTGSLKAYMKRDSNFTSVTVTTGGRLVRNNVEIVLDGENCNAFLYGLYLPSGRQHVDNHTMVDHAKPNSYSNELYKGIMDGFGTGVFNGRIIVRPDAQKTNAFQSNKNILLSNDANINTKPQLEIYADDVKCSHGATTGQMDDEALFYLQTRGIGKAEAMALMNAAFAGEILEHITHNGLREMVSEAVDRKIRIS